MIISALFLVGLPGLEPGKTGPESVVLPLHHSPIFQQNHPFRFWRCKDTAFYLHSKLFLHFFLLNAKKSIQFPILALPFPYLPTCFTQKSKNQERFHFLFFIHPIKPSIFVLCFLTKHFIVKRSKNERNKPFN